MKVNDGKWMFIPLKWIIIGFDPSPFDNLKPWITYFEWSPPTHSIWHIFWHSMRHFIWHIFWHFSGKTFWQGRGGEDNFNEILRPSVFLLLPPKILSGKSSDILSGICIWHIFWHSIWYIFGTSLWLRSGGEHSALELAVEVRRVVDDEWLLLKTKQNRVQSLSRSLVCRSPVFLWQLSWTHGNLMGLHLHASRVRLLRFLWNSWLWLSNRDIV